MSIGLSCGTRRSLSIQSGDCKCLPTLHAGGSGQLAAFRYMKDPVEVEFIKADAGLDIGDTAIGMHIKHVQVPIRPVLRSIGQAHVTASLVVQN